ncbi:hypothetical protein BDV28DRAFT_129306 [Aspergillus coremiiformis]|uniref:Uncharacterized protein n=1 Tax=Aspergillus coremiiformis TaxID=138285 RepID=A0A5N6ZCC7_9EURO|nr:hypothetical protein BDV28DRAFT_129306 [Aspergillus coremiiformis]
MASVTIPQFLLPRGPQSTRVFQSLIRANATHYRIRTPTRRCASNNSKQRVLGQPDKFRPPSHPARRVVQTRNGRIVDKEPVNYPGPRLSKKEREEQKHRKYPKMFPPEGTVMYKFLTSRWIHIWIAMSVLTSMATFTFTTNFKRSSPFAHLLPSWSSLLSHPIDTIREALSVYRMHVEHTSMQTRERRRQRIEDAEKRRQYRIAHGLEVDDQSSVAADPEGSEHVDSERKRRPVKKWLGIW